jgi:hypothetical protein
VAGSSLTGREAVARQADLLRQELLGDGASVLDQLLAERISLCWIWVHQADLELVEHLKRQPDSLACREAAKRLGQAQARYVSALKALAVVRRLLAPRSKPAPSPLELLGVPEKVKTKPGASAKRVAVCR